MENKSKDLPFLAHLKELRKRLLASVVAVIIGFVIVFVGFSPWLLSFLSTPLTERGVLIIHTGLAEAFATQMRISLIGGVIISAPVVLWQFWSFFGPALYPRERLAFLSTFCVIVLLFITGVLFAYFLVFNIAVNFFLLSGEGLATPMISIDRYVSMLMGFVLPFGIMFQLPVIITILYKLGIVSTQSLIKARKYVVFATFVISSLITPPDVVSLMMLAVPICLLYEASVLISRFSKKSQKQDV